MSDRVLRSTAARLGLPPAIFAHPGVKELARAYAEARVLEEREECARILDGVNSHDNPMTANDCADAIRARGRA